jgi:catechol 2,3-dioxygenase-like lactoylglutathione lyase family enzyme
MATVKPILRIFDYDKAIAFYIDWLGFQIDWKYGTDETPMYLQISLGDIVLHLSEHHGDGSPGASVFIDDFQGLAAYHKKLLEKNYKYNKPGIDAPFYDPHALEMSPIDPFGNRLIFVERNVKKQ